MTDTDKIAAYDALLAEAAKIQPSAGDTARSLQFNFDYVVYRQPPIRDEEQNRNLVVICTEVLIAAIERERLLGALRERTLRKIIADLLDVHCDGNAPNGVLNPEHQTYIDERCDEPQHIAAWDALNAAPPASDALSKVIELLRLTLGHTKRDEGRIREALRLLGEQP